MGLLSWLFPSDDDKMDKAQTLLDEGQWIAALDRLDGVEAERAEQIRDGAREGVKRRNLELAIACANAGELEAANDHMELAKNYAKKGDPDLRAARRALREARTAAPEKAQPQAPSAAGGVMGALGVGGGGGVAAGAGVLDPDAGNDPIFSLPPEDPRVRFALILEQYAPEHRAKLQALGPEFATAALTVQDGQANHGVHALGPFVAQEPLALLFRAEAAMASGNPAQAASDLKALVNHLGAHAVIGPHNTATLLAGALVSIGRNDDALTELNAGLKTQPKDVGLMVNKALVLERLKRDADADELARTVVQANSRVMAMYKLMARCRIRAGKRVEAMQALEAGLSTNCTSGKCGSLPFDVEAGRMLVQLYLEDAVEPARAAELLARLKRRLDGQTTWFEAYLDTLTARNDDAPDVLDRVRTLTLGVEAADPRTALVQRAFPGMA
jgi:hypothetical protein